MYTRDSSDCVFGREAVNTEESRIRRCVKKNVQQYMYEHDMHQKDISIITGMSPSGVSQALSDSSNKNFTIAQLSCLAKYFNITIDDLISDDLIIDNPRYAANILKQIKRLKEYPEFESDVL